MATETKDDDNNPKYIEVGGRIGYNSEMNGIYQKCTELWHDYPQWKQVSLQSTAKPELFYLRRNHESKIWQFDWITKYHPHSKYNSFAQCDSTTAKSPLQCQNQWTVWNTNTKSYIPDRAVFVKKHSTEQFEVTITFTLSYHDLFSKKSYLNYIAFKKAL